MTKPAILLAVLCLCATALARDHGLRTAVKGGLKVQDATQYRMNDSNRGDASTKLPDPDATAQGIGITAFARHHICPNNILQLFWDNMVQNQKLKDAMGTRVLQRMRDALHQGKLDAVLTDSPTAGCKAAKEEMKAVLDGLIANGVAYDLPDTQVKGWSCVKNLYIYWPGNIFIGPEGALRSCDPGDKFEGNACDHAPDKYEKAYDMCEALKAYNAAPTDAAKATAGATKMQALYVVGSAWTQKNSEYVAANWAKKNGKFESANKECAHKFPISPCTPA